MVVENGTLPSARRTTYTAAVITTSDSNSAPQESATSVMSGTSAPTSPPVTQSSMMGTIVGGVIGGISGVVILGLAFWYFKIRRMLASKPPTSPQPQPQPKSQPQSHSPPAVITQYEMGQGPSEVPQTEYLGPEMEAIQRQELGVEFGTERDRRIRY